MGFEEAFKAYVTEDSLNFLKEVKSVLEKIPVNDDKISVNESSPDVLRKIMIIAENMNLIMNLLKHEKEARQLFLKDHPAWNEKRRNLIEKLREIAKVLQTDTVNCNRSRLISYILSLVGDGLMLASPALLVPSVGVSSILGIAGGALIATGSATAFGTSVTEKALQKSLLNQAKEIINEDEKLFEGMSTWMEHAKKLKEAQSEILEMDIVKDIIKDVKKLIKKSMDIENADKRLNYIERKIKKMMKCLSKNIKGKIPVIGFKTIVSLLIGLVVVTSSAEYRFLFDCASLTIKSLVSVVILIDEIAGLAVKLATEATSGIAKAAARSTLAAIFIVIDTASIVKTSLDMYDGSFSCHAEKVSDIANEIEKEANVLQNAYNNLGSSRVKA